MPLYFWDIWISTWIRQLKWVENLSPFTLLHSQWISRLRCTISTQANCWCAGSGRKDSLSPYVPSDYTAVTGVCFHALFDGETLPKRVEILSREGPPKCCRNFESTFGATKWSEICQLQRVTRVTLPKLSSNWMTFDTQPILWNSGLCWPVSMPNLMWDKVMSKLGFYPALKRSINVGLGISLRSGVPWWYKVWQMLHSDLGKSIHSMSIHIARAIELRGDDEWRAYDMFEYWQAQRDSVMNEEHMICSSAMRQSILSASWKCGMSSPVNRTGFAMKA